MYLLINQPIGGSMILGLADKDILRLRVNFRQFF